MSDDYVATIRLLEKALKNVTEELELERRTSKYWYGEWERIKNKSQIYFGQLESNSTIFPHPNQKSITT